jgi:hypothetical protein
MAIPLRPEEVPKDLICAICLSVPLTPCTLEGCSHLFCNECISESLSHQLSCPVCRDYAEDLDIRYLREGTLGYRIWCSIIVKCDNHESGCSWTGSISDYNKHKRNSCRRQQNTDAQRNREIIDALEQENDSLEDKLYSAERILNGIIMKCDVLKQQLEQTKEEKNLALQNCVREKPDSNGKGGYDYDRHSVVKLTKLICQNLVSKPCDINGNKIFERVRHIYVNLKQGRADNPDHLYIDVRMLFGVCLASNWFTDNQLKNLKKFAIEQSWI